MPDSKLPTCVGSHHYLRLPGHVRLVVVPVHGNHDPPPTPSARSYVKRNSPLMNWPSCCSTRRVLDADTPRGRSRLARRSPPSGRWQRSRLAFVQWYRTYEGALPDERPTAIEVDEVDLLRPGELDQLECRRRGVHPVVVLGQDTDVQVACLAFSPGGATEDGEYPHMLSRAECVKLARLGG